MPRVAVVLRSYNEAQLIDRCLDAVFGQEFDSFEVILVDSGSTDGTLRIARQFPQLVIVPIAKAEFTYGRALNVGARSAAMDCQVIAFLSAHAIPTSVHWLRSLTEPIFTNDNVAGCYGKQAPLPEHLSNRVVRHLARVGYPATFGDAAFITNQSYFFSNANAAVRFSCWKKTPYDETIAGSEDHQWTKQMLAAGWAVAYAPDACVLHSHPDSLAQFFRRRRNEERGYVAIEGSQSRSISLSEYVRSVQNLARVFARQVRGKVPFGDALDALLVEGTLQAAAYRERRRVRNVVQQEIARAAGETP